MKTLIDGKTDHLSNSIKTNGGADCFLHRNIAEIAPVEDISPHSERKRPSRDYSQIRPFIISALVYREYLNSRQWEKSLILSNHSRFENPSKFGRLKKIDLITREINRLSKRQEVLLKMYYLENLSLRDMARAFSQSEEQVGRSLDFIVDYLANYIDLACRERIS